MQTLDVISINLWDMVISLANLVLLFLIIKRFLYKPVKRMLEQRQSTINKDYADAEQAKADALQQKQAYEEKLDSAKAEADSVIKSAAETASLREREIIADAKEKAVRIVRKAEEDAALEKKKAEESIRHEIVAVSSALTEKLLDREINTNDHEKLIDSFIEGIGEDNETNS